jgi:hypothetical protein
MAAYKVLTGTNTAGTWAAEIRRDLDHESERRLARTGFVRKPLGVVNGYGLDESAAVADAISKAQEKASA